MRVAFIGATAHYGSALRAASSDPDLHIVGAAPGSDGESLAGINRQAERLHIELTNYGTMEELLDTARPDLAVVDCHYGDHAAASIAAMEQGVHVYANKPAATTLAELEELREVHRRTKVQLTSMIGGSRYGGAVHAARKAVLDGRVGEIRLMSGQKSYKLGSRPDFFRSRRRHGGTIPWVGIYPIAWFRWVSRLDFRRVTAFHSRRGNGGYGELEVTAVMQFVMDDEVAAVAHTDYFRPQGAPTHGDDRLRITGTEGLLEVRDRRLLLIDDHGERELPSDGGEGSLFRDFVGQIRGEGQCRLSAEEAFYLTEIALRARQSADEGRSVTL